MTKRGDDEPDSTPAPVPDPEATARFQAPVEGAPATTPTPRAGVQPLVLVLVDDDPMELTLMQRALEARGHTTTAFTDVQTALKTILASPPHVVVSDLNMPLEGGLQLLERLRQKLGVHAPPVVIVSGESDVDPISGALDAGAAHFVQKPFTKGQLVAVVERAARGPLARMAAQKAADPPRFLGEFEILEQIGAGGMGRVYRARSVQNGVEAVLKLLDPAAGHVDELLRFRREFEVLAQLEHPGMPRVYGCSTDLGWTYIVMELVPGENLDHRIRRAGPVAFAEGAAIGTHVASTLAYVHQRGIVHRDVKPSNVILRQDGAPPCLIDFGLARRSRDLGVSSRFEIFGTPAYCAPELASPGGVGPMADVFSLGVTLYEAFLGRHPLLWQLESLAPLDLILSYARSAVPDLRKYVEDAPEALALLLARMLEPDPARRPDAATAASELRAIARTLSTSPGPSSG